ncbi:MAG TPA: mycofactocin system transcriptional regulator [Beutenbergiaceae bacterium]|nr:mycofactocin system transcriptional regulator [Beutenbergiaceae bacterium]
MPKNTTINAGEWQEAMEQQETNIDHVSARPTTQRTGRSPATTHAHLSSIALDLFLQRGFDATTIDDIAAAAGIGRRTLFRYFDSKNELAWGEFGDLLDTMRQDLQAIADDVPLVEALRATVVKFNSFPEAQIPQHRGRMSLIFNVPSLYAHSMVKYTQWRNIIADFVAERYGGDRDDLAPQSISWICLGLCLSAYQFWVAHRDSDLIDLLNEVFSTAHDAFALPTMNP